MLRDDAAAVPSFYTPITLRFLHFQALSYGYPKRQIIDHVPLGPWMDGHPVAREPRVFANQVG
jgi:hypothetical protein